jgi:ribosomal protein S8
MNLNDIPWSKTEKDIARKIFDAAYLREMNQIHSKVLNSITNYKEPKDIWKLHDYLTQKREEIDLKYDYRYSVLITVFSRLYKEGIIKYEELIGLSEEKLTKIKAISEIMKI